MFKQGEVTEECRQRLIQDTRDEMLTLPLLIGVAFDLLQFIVLTTQIFAYCDAFPRDRPILKKAVSFVYLVGIAQTILALVDLYHAYYPPLVILKCAHGDRVLFGSIPGHFWFSVVASTTIVAFVAQMLYAYWIRILTKNWWIIGLIVALSVLQGASGLVGCFCTGSIWGNDANTDLCSSVFDTAWGLLNFICALVIAIYLSVFLLRKRRSLSDQVARVRVSALVQLLIEIGFLTSITVLCYTILFRAVKLETSQCRPTPWYFVPGIPMAKVYSNSMLALLRSRATIPGRLVVGNTDFETFEWEACSSTHGSHMVPGKGVESTQAGLHSEVQMTKDRKG